MVGVGVGMEGLEEVSFFVVEEGGRGGGGEGGRGRGGGGVVGEGGGGRRGEGVGGCHDSFYEGSAIWGKVERWKRKRLETKSKQKSKKRNERTEILAYQVDMKLHKSRRQGG